jgi:leucyl aminopeptidase
VRLNVVAEQPWDQRVDVLAVAVPNDRQPPAYVTEIDRRLGGAIEAMRTLGAVKGALWEARLIPGRDMGARFVLAVGIADGQKLDRTGARRLGGVIIRKLMGCDVRHLGVHVPDDLVARGGVQPGGFFEQLVRGLVEGAEEPSTIYLDATDKLPPALDECTLVVESGDADDLLTRAERGQVIAAGTNRTRRLAQRAANDVSPEVLADEASDIARQFGMTLTVIGPEEAVRMGMGMFMAIGRGSANQPRFIALRSGPDVERDGRDRLLALVGKGVTFDSGGISIKPSERMDDMKMDKSGACAVLHAIATANQLAPGIPLLAVAPAVENMPGPHSARPGDVVTALNGKAVEITNTDAEGRLILGDAMTWAERQGATHVVDVATLTGAVSRALGRSMTGGFGTDEPLWADMAAAARRQGEPLWRLPIVDDYRADMDSPYADIVNSGSAEGSLVKSAIFLREFVTKPWVHLDIAGSAYLQKDAAWTARGSTGAMHASLVELCLDGSSGPMSTLGEEDPGAPA